MSNHSKCDWQSVNINHSVSYSKIIRAVLFNNDPWLSGSRHICSIILWCTAAERAICLSVSFCLKVQFTWAAREASYFTETVPLLNVCRLYFRQKANIVSSSYHVLCASVLECDSKPPQVVSVFMENSAICYCNTQDGYSLLYMCKYTNWDPKAGAQPPDGCY